MSNTEHEIAIFAHIDVSRRLFKTTLVSVTENILQLFSKARLRQNNDMNIMLKSAISNKMMQVHCTSYWENKKTVRAQLQQHKVWIILKKTTQSYSM